MLNLLLVLAAAPAPPMARPEPVMREIRQGPMPFQERTMSQPHPNSDDRMFPDIAVKGMRIDRDTLYVELVNQGHGSARVPILVVARAEANGVRSEAVEARTARLTAGESRWVPLKGFAVKSVSLASPVFDLASANIVSAAARLLPSTAGALDRSGQGCGDCSIDSDESNNLLTLHADSIKRSN
jgi:hypothetical protein